MHNTTRIHYKIIKIKPFVPNIETLGIYDKLEDAEKEFDKTKETVERGEVIRLVEIENALKT